MDMKQIAFIICNNNMQYYNECVRYIQDLEVPEGYSIDIISIGEANSMASGYNAGMQASNAKYKVYLHQDLFILNRRFIYDIVRIFQKNSAIGMMGMIGSQQLSEDAWCMNYNIGKMEGYNGRCTIDDFLYQMPTEEYTEVQAVDGCILVTQYDIFWREDILDGWDFYDVSQSLEMKRNGYKVVVPYQDIAWCYHDCGCSKLIKYDYYRRKMMHAYPNIFSGMVNEEKELGRKKEVEALEKIRKRLLCLIEIGDYGTLNEAVQKLRYDMILDTQIREIMNLMEIYSLEKQNVSGTSSEWFDMLYWEDIYTYYKEIRFILMRIEYEREDERIEWLKEKVQNGEVSRDAIRKLSAITLTSTFRVYERLLKEAKEEPLVSVIVAVYNGEDTIAGTLDSIRHQTYKNIEVIVVDDASTDNSRKILSEYQEKDVRIKPVFLEKNKNVCNAGNKGFEQASGKYVTLVGHDDIWRSDKLEKQVSFMEEHPIYSVCFTWADIIDENNNIINQKCQQLYNKFCADNMEQNRQSRKIFWEHNSFCAPSACIRAKLLKRTGYYRYGLVQLQDYDLWLRMLQEGPMYIIQEKLTKYRRFNEEGRNLSTTNQKTSNRDYHEQQWIKDVYVEGLAPEKFIQIFGQDMKNKDARSEKEIRCEKAFLLLQAGDFFAIKHLIELLEDEECRKILEEKYQFELKDFYELNAQPMLVDSTYQVIVSQKEQQIESYKQLLEQQKNIFDTEQL